MPIEVRKGVHLWRLVLIVHLKKAAQAQSKIKILEKLPDLQPPEAAETETFR